MPYRRPRRTRAIDPPATPTTRTSTLRSAVECGRDAHVRQRRAAVADRGDVRRRAADLEHDRVGDAGVSQRTRDRRRRSRVQRAHRRRTEPGQVGRPAVAAHDHHRRSDAGRLHAVGDERRRAHCDRQDRGVERGGDRAQLEPVEAAQVGRRAHRQAELGGDRGDGPFVAGIVGRERLGDADRGDAGVAEPDRARRGPRPSGRPSVTSKNACLTRSRLPGASSTSRSRVRFSTRDRSGRRPMPITPDLGGVALDQRVDGLRGRMGDEIDVVRADLFGELGDRLRRPRRRRRPRPCAWSARRRWRRSTGRCSSTATALVNVPPTSTPTRTRVMSRPARRGALGTRCRAAMRGRMTNTYSAPQT